VREADRPPGQQPEVSRMRRRRSHQEIADSQSAAATGKSGISDSPARADGQSEWICFLLGTPSCGATKVRMGETCIECYA
jgi:hypothetical protein